MKRRVTVLGMSAVVALALAAASASSAFAKEGLVLTEAGTPAAEKAPAKAIVLLDGCFQSTPGTLESNGKKKDKAKFSGVPSTECEEGSELTGNITEAKLGAEGVLAYKTTLVLKLGKCAYTFKKMSNAFAPNEGVTGGFGEATGKMNKTVSETKECAKTFTTSFTAGVYDQEEEPFGTTIVS